jgi:hypothetical protein
LKFNFSALSIRGNVRDAQIEAQIENSTEKREARLCTNRVFSFPEGDQSEGQFAASFPFGSWKIGATSHLYYSLSMGMSSYFGAALSKSILKSSKSKQFLPDSSDASRNASNGSWNLRSRMVAR